MKSNENKPTFHHIIFMRHRINNNFEKNKLVKLFHCFKFRVSEKKFIDNTKKNYISGSKRRRKPLYFSFFCYVPHTHTSTLSSSANMSRQSVIKSLFINIQMLNFILIEVIVPTPYTLFELKFVVDLSTKYNRFEHTF